MSLAEQNREVTPALELPRQRPVSSEAEPALGRNGLGITAMGLALFRCLSQVLLYSTNVP